MKIILVTISLFLLYSQTNANTSELEYKSDCGEGNQTTKEECFSDITTPISPKRCCHVQGHIQLDLHQACKSIEDTHEERLNLLHEYESISTGVKVDCGSKKIMESTCNIGSPEPKQPKDCNKFQMSDNSMYCCFVEITSLDFNGTACMEFSHLDINTIGQAVRAAETVKAKLKVNCSSAYLYHTILFAFIILLLV